MTKLLIDVDEALSGEKSNNFPMKRRLKFWDIKKKKKITQPTYYLADLEEVCYSTPPKFWFNLQYSPCAYFFFAQICWNFFFHQVRKVNFDTHWRKHLSVWLVFLNVVIKSSKQDGLCLASNNMFAYLNPFILLI